MPAYHMTIQGGTLPYHVERVQCATVGAVEELAVHVAGDVMRELSSGGAPSLSVVVKDGVGKIVVIIEAGVRRP